MRGNEVKVTVSAEVNTILSDLYGQIEYELRDDYEDGLEKAMQELERYKNIIDELILTGLASSITKEDFEYMWKVAYNKEYNPNDIKEIAERHGILKGE